MDMVSLAAAMSADVAAAKTQEAASMAVLKMTMEQQGAAILPLIQAATGVSTAPASANSPAHLGQSIDVFV